MITDALLQLSSAQAVTGTAVSANTVDLGAGRDVGRGEPLLIAITVDQSVIAAGAATVTFQVVTSASANLGAPLVLAQTDAIPKADLVAGRQPIYMRVSRELLSTVGLGQRYLGLQYVVWSGPLTSGQFTAQVVHEAQAGNRTLYPANRTVY